MDTIRDFERMVSDQPVDTSMYVENYVEIVARAIKNDFATVEYFDNAVENDEEMFWDYLSLAEKQQNNKIN